MSDFTNYMNGRRAWVLKAMKEGTSVAYETPRELLGFRGRVQYAALNSTEQGLLADFQEFSQENALVYSNGEQSAILSLTEPLQLAPTDPIAQTKFQTQMTERRQIAINSAIVAVNALYDEALKIGAEHPNLQPGLVTAMDVIDLGFNAVMKDMIKFISNAIQTVVEWINNAISSITETFTAIGDFISSWFGLAATSRERTVCKDDY